MIKKNVATTIKKLSKVFKKPEAEVQKMVDMEKKNAMSAYEMTDLDATAFALNRTLASLYSKKKRC